MFRKLIKQGNTPRIGMDEIADHLSEKFGIARDDITTEFTKDQKGWRAGKTEYKDTFRVIIKQPAEEPNLHQYMHDEMKKVFHQRYGASAFNPKAMRFYFGVSVDKEHSRLVNIRKDDNLEISMVPENH